MVEKKKPRGSQRRPRTAVVEFGGDVAASGASGLVPLEMRSIDSRVVREDAACYCDLCEMWLNGPDQLDTHETKRKHTRNMRKREMQMQSNGGTVESDKKGKANSQEDHGKRDAVAHYYKGGTAKNGWIGPPRPWSRL